MIKIITILLIAVASVSHGQTPIVVAENTLKVSASNEEVFYYGFAEGDQVIFSFEEVNGKELKELEISFLPSSSIFMDYKTKKIDDKILNIAETGIYKFRFSNSNLLAGRVCKFKIQRIPLNEQTLKFNTKVYKRTLYDTTYFDIQEKYLVRADTSITEIVNQVAKVHSTMNANGNKTIANFKLPNNTIAWSYYIGVDQVGQQVFENATKQLVSKSTPLITNLIGANPLAALALNLPSFLSQLQAGEDIDYYLVDGQNANLFLAGQEFRLYKRGKVINDFSKMEPINGNLSFCLSNDNAVTGVTVMIKVTAVQLNSVWDSRSVKKMKVNAKEDMYLKN